MVSQKIFRQVLTTHGFPLSESEVACVALVYGFQNNEVKYVEFLKDCNVLKYTINAPTTGIKSTYTPHFINFNGANEFNILMEKIKNIIKRDRIRLLEFFQDFDLLRKGTLQPSKFRSVLHTQKVQLTAHEYDILESTFAAPNTSNAPLVNYVVFCEQIASIFTDKGLEKNPTGTIATFKAPSILDPKNQLADDEDIVLDACLQRLGTHVRNHRLLLKPFFQDKDKSSSGFINMTRFRSIFDNLKLSASEEEFSLINRRF